MAIEMGEQMSDEDQVELVSYNYTPELDAAVRAVKNVKGFAAEMREKGIHVGLGMPGVCVTCDEMWPCAGSKG